MSFERVDITIFANILLGFFKSFFYVKIFQIDESWLNLAILTGLLFLFNFLLSSQMPADQALDLRFAYSVQEA